MIKRPFSEKSPGKSVWLLPGALVVTFSAVLGVLLLTIFGSREEQLHRELRTAAISVNETLLRNLNGNRDYFLLLANDMAAGRLDAETFQARVSRYVLDNPELINVTWADKDFVIRWTAPYERNKHVVGLTLTLPEPKRASHQAKATRAPVYTRVFEAIQGKAAFEIYVPVFRGEEFLGTLGGVYAVASVLAHALPEALNESYHVSFLKSGMSVASLARAGTVDEHLVETIPLEFPGYGAALKLVAYRDSAERISIWLSVLVAALAIGMAWSMWAFARDAHRRKVAEHALIREKERAQVTLHSIGDAVITTDAMGIIEFINPIAQKLTGWSSDDAPGEHVSAVFNIVHEGDRTPIQNPVTRVLAEGEIVSLGNHTLLINREGREYSIQDSAAPIWGSDEDLQGVVLVFSDVTETRRRAVEAAHQAAHDPLTGLVNRREFENRLQRVLDTAKVDHSEHVLCYVDLDQFKVINDTCGHIAGDELLRQLSVTLMEQIRKRDTFARLGGDEFGILMEHCSIEQGKRVADGLHKTISGFQFAWEGKGFRVGSSMGLVPLTAASENLTEVLRCADTACYAAKDAGRNRIHIYRDDDISLAERHGEMQWVARIHRALEEDRLHLYYPKKSGWSHKTPSMALILLL